MTAIGGERIESLRRMMDLVKLPEDGHAVEQPVSSEEREIGGEKQRDREQDLGHPVAGSGGLREARVRADDVRQQPLNDSPEPLWEQRVREEDHERAVVVVEDHVLEVDPDRAMRDRAA